MESMLHEIARCIAMAIEVMAIVIIAFGALEALIAIVRLWMRADATSDDRRIIWMNFGRWLVAALHSSLPPTRRHVVRAHVG